MVTRRMARQGAVVDAYNEDVIFRIKRWMNGEEGQAPRHLYD
jgi:hypothetical protein